MNQTTDAMVSSVKSMCDKVVVAGLLKTVRVNDWGRYGNFEVFVEPMKRGPGCLSSMKSIITKHLPEGAKVRNVIPPEKLPTDMRKRVIAMSNPQYKYWKFDIDFMNYNAESNAFS